jgi:hypothetical protein
MIAWSVEVKESMKLSSSWKALSLLSSVLTLSACGGDDDDEPGANANGTVTEAWSDFCTATFTKDTPLVDAFGDPAFTARAGDEYLLSEFDDAFGGRAEILYLTNAGPESFTLEPGSDGSWPFTSDCAIGEGVPYYAVFTDVSLYAEKELTTKICDLGAGSVLPASGTGRGYAYAGPSGDSAIYEIVLGPFSAECGDRDSGYVRVPQTRSFGSVTWLVPFAGVIGPKQ